MDKLHVVVFTVILHLYSNVKGNLLDNCPHNLPRDANLFTHGGYCLQVVQHKKDWDDARTDCHRRGGELLQIRDSTMQNVVSHQIQSRHYSNHGFWIGASDRHHEGTWKWVAGDKTMTYSHWHPGQGPSQSGFLFAGGVIEDCALLRSDDSYMWHDYPCAGGVAYHYYYICQYNALITVAPKTTRRIPQKTSMTTMSPTTRNISPRTMTSVSAKVSKSPTTTMSSTTKVSQSTTMFPTTTKISITTAMSTTTVRMYPPTTTTMSSTTTSTMSPTTSTKMSPTTTSTMSPSTTSTMSPATTTTMSPTTTSTMSPTTTSTMSPTTTSTISPTTSTTMSPTTTTTMSPSSTSTMSLTMTTAMSPTTTTPTTTTTFSPTTTTLKSTTTMPENTTPEADGHIIGGKTQKHKEEGAPGVADSLKSVIKTSGSPSITVILIGVLGVVTVGFVTLVVIIIFRRMRSHRQTEHTHAMENPLYGITLSETNIEGKENMNDLYAFQPYTVNLDESTS